jgi:hypothetical protein
MKTEMRRLYKIGKEVLEKEPCGPYTNSRTIDRRTFYLERELETRVILSSDKRQRKYTVWKVREGDHEAFFENRVFMSGEFQTKSDELFGTPLIVRCRGYYNSVITKLHVSFLDSMFIIDKDSVTFPDKSDFWSIFESLKPPYQKFLLRHTTRGFLS